MPRIQVGDIEIYYECAGTGDPVLFISGTGGDLRNKPNVFDSPVGQAFELLAYDQRGLGQTSKPDEPYSMAAYADDAAGLMDALGWESAHVIGVSFGGMVAQEFVLRHPHKVRRLVLACTSPGGAGGASFAFHEIEHLTGEARARHLIPINDTRRTPEWIEANPDTFRMILDMTLADPFAGEPGRAMGAHRQLEARSHHDTWDRLPSIRKEVLIAAGTFDAVALPETQHRLAAQIPGAQLRFFKGGHMFTIQDRTAWPAIISFLNTGAAPE